MRALGWILVSVAFLLVFVCFGMLYGFVKVLFVLLGVLVMVWIIWCSFLGEWLIDRTDHD